MSPHTCCSCVRAFEAIVAGLQQQLVAAQAAERVVEGHAKVETERLQDEIERLRAEVAAYRADVLRDARPQESGG
mgnify:CR=1 FL=1